MSYKSRKLFKGFLGLYIGASLMQTLLDAVGLGNKVVSRVGTMVKKT